MIKRIIFSWYVCLDCVILVSVYASRDWRDSFMYLLIPIIMIATFGAALFSKEKEIQNYFRALDKLKETKKDITIFGGELK